MENPRPKCFVPNCYNEVGVLFPKNQVMKKKWLNSLNIGYMKPSSTSFICLEHFDDNGSSGTLPHVIKSIKKNGESKEITKNVNTMKEPKVTKEDSTICNQNDTESQGSEITPKDIVHKQKNISKDNEVFDSICRLCMAQSSKEMENIYSKIDKHHSIAEAIITCLYPLKVSPKDKLSQNICTKCLEILKEFYEFHQFCIGMDEKQRELISMDYEDDFSDNSEDSFLVESLEDYVEKTVKQQSPQKSDIDKKFEKVEELLKVLEGDKSSNKIEKKNDDNLYTENIVIEMVNDENDEPPSQVETLVNNLPITIKTIYPNLLGRKPVKRKLEDVNNSNITMIKTGKDSNEVVVLPSGIKVKQKYCSPVGVFACKIVKYYFNLEYVKAAECLYSTRLTKQNFRYLHCIALKCPGEAIQRKDSSGSVYKKEVEVIVAHNHPAPDPLERKKQICYSIIYKKMRTDKNFNYKVAYEQITKVDPSIRDTIPLRKIMCDLCTPHPETELPRLKSFDDFFSTIENSIYKKVHFTLNENQFYQEKFESGDGAKGVVFANSEVVNRYSDSKIMFVDASFYIETDAFFYQVLTVLVWVYDSYYPIVFAIVNAKSQELYKFIFDFIYNSLAPKLRPSEIITDYECNLYYALGEIYLDSSIGGSLFYYTQNLYKKVCSLKLAKELELNSNFRSIYNMILMLPLLPVNTILDGLKNIEIQAKELDVDSISSKLFRHVYDEWICKVTPELFCVHRLENRINEHIVAPFKKFRDLIMAAKSSKHARWADVMVNIPLIHVIEKLIDLENFLRETYNNPNLKKSFAKDLSSSQKKNVLKAWQYIEEHPKININNFFMKVLGYIKCMENQLWIWGFYRYALKDNDQLINAANFSILNEGPVRIIESIDPENESQDEDEEMEGIVEEYFIEENGEIQKIETRMKMVGEDDFDGQQQTLENENNFCEIQAELPLTTALVENSDTGTDNEKSSIS